MLRTNRITLHEGPFNGGQSIASHWTAYVGGELYVWDGSEDETSFVHAKTMLGKLSDDQHKAEQERVRTWMHATGEKITLANGKEVRLPRPLSELIGIPPHRINAWVELIKTGEVHAA